MSIVKIKGDISLDIINILIKEFDININYLQAAIKLIDEGNTIPFIARYRKELTGQMSDQTLRELEIRLNYLRNLEEKREQYKNSIKEMEKLTFEIEKALNEAKTLVELEDIYRPYRPKRRTRATIAKEKGLEPLALKIFEQNLDQRIESLADDEELKGAMDIIAEIISDTASYRDIIRRKINKDGIIVSNAINIESESVYEMYYSFSEPIKKIMGHRILAINRGEKEGILKVFVEIDTKEILDMLSSKINNNNPFSKQFIDNAIEDSYKRLIFPSIEREIRNSLTESAEEKSIKVFSENLRQLLMQPPIANKIVLAIDPGYRTGCKICVINEIGEVMHTGIIYPTKPASKIDEANKIITNLVNEYSVDIIAIGNGTASRETEKFVSDLLKTISRKLNYIIINEAGASIYSASKLAAEEFPDYDVSLRSAISIARRLQDPLSELVKIEPKGIGIGQYQHDMNQKNLTHALEGVVESCVNSVGVDLNMASISLLSYVSGINSTIAKNILKFKKDNGKFKNRLQLLKVKGLGPKAFEQCAGFLRINDGENKLDKTGVHPESYPIVEKLLKIKNKDELNIKELSNILEIGEPTLYDIIKELEKPGRDPREDIQKPILSSEILSIEDLNEGMVLKGTIRNIIDFGAFVDIGVHQDGLVHISKISKSFIKHPLDAISLGDIVDVKVLSIDIIKKRISLSMIL